MKIDWNLARKGLYDADIYAKLVDLGWKPPPALPKTIIHTNETGYMDISKTPAEYLGEVAPPTAGEYTEYLFQNCLDADNGFDMDVATRVFQNAINTHTAHLKQQLAAAKEELELIKALRDDAEDISTVLAKRLAVAMDALSFYAAGIGHSEIEDNGKIALAALAKIYGDDHG